MLAPWALEEMATADLSDKRLNDRLNQILSDFACRPTASIPAACGGYNEMVAAYRFMDNDKATFRAILDPHVKQTRRRMAEQETVLIAQDTTEIDLTKPEQQVQGAGPLDGSARRGGFIHPLHAFTIDGTPLGTAWCMNWAREQEAEPLSKEQKRRQRKAAPIEEKESQRWIEGLRQAREIAQEMPQTRCVCIADSEADIYEFFAEPQGLVPVHWLIRACQDRALEVMDDDEPGPEFEADESRDSEEKSEEKAEAGQVSSHLRSRVMDTPVLFTRQITVRGRKAKLSCETRGRRQSRVTRPADLEVRAATVTLRPPWRPGSSLPPVVVHVVVVSEPSPPEGEEPIEWILATTLPIDTLEQVQQIIEYYCVRWMIEVFFRTLKSGCRVEERRFERWDRWEACVAVYLIVAWRTLMVCRLGQSCPEMDCEAIFDPSEWKSVWVTAKRQAPPKTPPRLSAMLRLIAQLGGYVNRPNRPDPPGPQTVWLGMQRMYDLAAAWNAFGPGAKPLK
jgi:Transposase DNA-binding/Transposase Tn5 dimerisation domain